MRTGSDCHRVQPKRWRFGARGGSDHVCKSGYAPSFSPMNPGRAPAPTRFLVGARTAEASPHSQTGWLGPQASAASRSVQCRMVRLCSVPLGGLNETRHAEIPRRMAGAESNRAAVRSMRNRARPDPSNAARCQFSFHYYKWSWAALCAARPTLLIGKVGAVGIDHRQGLGSGTLRGCRASGKYRRW